MYHTCDIAHLRLHRGQRVKAAGLLAAGIPLKDVLDRVHLSADNGQVSYLHLVTAKDIQNIARDFGVTKGAVLHKNDADSVAAWVALNQEADGETS